MIAYVGTQRRGNIDFEVEVIISVDGCWLGWSKDEGGYSITHVVVAWGVLLVCMMIYLFERNAKAMER